MGMEGWAIADHPVYGVEGWPTPWTLGTSGVMAVIVRDGEPAQPVAMSRDVHHGDSRRSITITSSRPLSAHRRENAWGRIAGGSEGPAWAVTTIRVDDIDHDFEVATLGSTWVAIADVRDTAITITARNVDIAEVRLVEILDAPPPLLPRMPPRPAPRSRVMPAPPAPTGEPVTVEFTYRDRRLLTGTAMGTPLKLALVLPVSRGTAQGRFGPAEVAARWVSSTDPVTVTGSIGPMSVTLTGTFRHGTDSFFDSADISGHAGSDVITARIERADGAMSSDTIHADGTIGQTSFALWSTVGGDLRDGVVFGSVGGRGVDIRATRTGNMLHVIGSYDGPEVLLLVIVGAVSFFM